MAAAAATAASKGNGGGGGRAGAGEASGSRKKRGPGPLATAYLVIYNVVMTAGIFTLCNRLDCGRGILDVSGSQLTLEYGYPHFVGLEVRGRGMGTGDTEFVLWWLLSPVLMTFLSEKAYFYIKVTHVFSFKGIVPSSVVLTSFQVMSRVFLIWAVTHSVKEVQSEDCVLLFVIAWTITEIIRYSFYTFSLLNHLPYLIKWARYTLFIVLYPMGVSGELLTIYAALPFVRQAGLYSISLPNKYNFSFDYYAFLILIMISYIPIFPQLYFHMIHQRRKILSHTEEHKKFE